MLEFLRRQLEKLLTERAALKSEVDKVLEAPTKEERELKDDEAALFNEKRAAVKAHDEQIEQMRERVLELEDDEKRSERANAAAAELGQVGEQRERQAVRVGAEPETYRKHGPSSYFRDLTAVSLQRSGAREAHERLERNGKEVRALSTTDGAGGEFVPPLWMIQDFIQLARAGRVVADQVGHQPLPAGTDTVSLPRLATGTAVAEQATQNTAVQNTDATTNSITANVASLAGQQVVSLQLIEQSPINMDDVLLADLAADYAGKLDVFVISNNAAGKLGLLSVSGINAVTYTDATPTVPELYPKIADAIQQVHTGRFMPPQKMFMHPRRWAWFEAAVDSSGRPLALAAANMPQNAIATISGDAAEGFVGVIQGLPVYVDPNIPINLGAGTNEDRIIAARTDDVILYEGIPRAESFREPLAAQLSVLLRFYNYAALHASRYPKSISVISGTGLATPTF